MYRKFAQAAQTVNDRSTKGLCASRSDLIVALPLGPSLSNHFLSYAATKFL
jgi:hypothetical protein